VKLFIKLKQFLDNEKVALKWATSLLLIGCILFGVNLSESKIGLNNQNIIISETCDKIEGLGKETKFVLYSYKTTDNLAYLYDSDKINEQRMFIIKSHFKVGKNMLRDEMFFISIIFMVISLDISAIIFMWVIFKQTIDSYILKRKFEEAVNKISK